MMYSKLWDVLNDNEQNYMLPFYWQHGDHYETIPAEVERIYNSGCRAFCVESRPHKEFAGEGWWRDMDLILSEAKKRDMQVWVLDDDHFPTGHAVGHIEKYHPDKRRWDLGERHVDVLGPVKDALLLTNERETAQILGIYAYKRTGEGEVCDLDTVIDLTNCRNEKFVQVTLPEGMWRVFFFYKTQEHERAPYYIDLLSPDSVRVLIDAVYETHYEHYKEYFGNTLQGFFSDEPQFQNGWFSSHASDPGMYEHRLGLPGMAYPWCEQVFVKMKEQLGYDPLPYLSAIWFDMGGKTPELRLAYMDAVTRLYRENFTRQIGDWCVAHGVQYIGHIIEDMGTHSRTGSGAGHYFRSLDGQHMSGIDIVLHQLMPGMSDYIHTASTHGNNADPEFFDYVLCKLAPSLAHIAKDMKQRAMCEVFGAYGWAESGSDMKWLLDHLLVRGVNHFVPHAFSPLFPDPDCPPHFGADGKDPQYDAFSRLMSYGNKVSHLLYGGTHIADAAILYTAELEWMNTGNEALRMQTAAKILYDRNIDFDFLPIDTVVGDKEMRLFAAEAENGKLKVGKETYKMLVVPVTPVMPDYLTEKLAAFEAAGVNVVYYDGDHTVLCDAITKLDADITVTGERKFLRSCHYVDGGNDIYMFANESLRDPANCTVTLNSVQSENGVCLDLLNDTVYAVKAEDGKISLKLEPNQSCLFVFGDTAEAELPAKKAWSTSVLADLTFKIETASCEDMTNFTLLKENVKADELFSITSLDCMPEFSGLIRYTAVFDSKDLPQNETLALDLTNAGNTARLFLNGEDLGIRLTKPYRFDLSGKVKTGENVLVIEVANTLANKVKDYFSSFMTIPAAGLYEPIYWVTE